MKIFKFIVLSFVALSITIFIFVNFIKNSIEYYEKNGFIIETMTRAGTTKMIFLKKLNP